MRTYVALSVLAALIGTGSVFAFTRTYGPSSMTALPIAQIEMANQVTLPSSNAADQASVEAASLIVETRILKQEYPHPTSARIRPVQQPEASLLPPGALDIAFTSFVIEAGIDDLHITSIGIERTGAASSGIFEAVAVVDETDEEIANEKALNAQNKAVFLVDIWIPSGSSKAFTVIGSTAEELADYDGQMPSLSVFQVEANTSLDGKLPLLGTTHTVNASLSIGALQAMRSPLDPATDMVRYIDEDSITFSAIRIVPIREDASLTSIAWDQAGSVGPSDIENVKTIIDGEEFAAERIGRTYVTSFDAPVTLKRGRFVDVSVRADLLPSAANRSVKFDVRKPEDIGAVGLEYGFGIGISASGNTDTTGNSVFITSDGSADGEAGMPFYSGSVVSVRGGTVNSVSRP